MKGGGELRRGFWRCRNWEDHRQNMKKKNSIPFYKGSHELSVYFFQYCTGMYKVSIQSTQVEHENFVLD